VPFYDYVCDKCGHEVEIMHSVHGHGPSACPKCGGEMKKAITAAAVHYKGSGWARKERSGKAAKPATGDVVAPSTPDIPAPSGDTTKASD
jgi:putative FmdB family regulatory protein